MVETTLTHAGSLKYTVLSASTGYFSITYYPTHLLYSNVVAGLFRLETGCFTSPS